MEDSQGANKPQAAISDTVSTLIEWMATNVARIEIIGHNNITRTYILW